MLLRSGALRLPSGAGRRRLATASLSSLRHRGLLQPTAAARPLLLLSGRDRPRPHSTKPTAAETAAAAPQTVTVEINGKPIEVPAYSTILEAARAAGSFVPTLCAHPSIPARATCRICLVELETGQGTKKVTEPLGPADAAKARRVEKVVPVTKMVPACTTQVKEGQRIHTHSPAVIENVRFVLQLMRAKHPNSCINCDASGSCTFQDLLYRFQVEDVAPEEVRKPFSHHHEWDSCPMVAEPVDSQEPIKEGEAYNAIWLDQDKCIKCGRCVAVCEKVQGIGAIGFVGRGDEERVSTVQGLPLDLTKCIECGQCSAICPTGAMRERHDIFEVMDALEDKDRVKVAAIAPSVRVAMAEEFGLEPGGVSIEQMVEGLKKLGFDVVFDTNFAADLTVMEEGSELLARVKGEPGAGPLPMFTSCCPGWVNLVEKSYPDLIPHLSSCKSPQGMMGALIKNVYAPRVLERDPADVVSVSVMPCTAKKDEAHRPQDRQKTYSEKLDTTVPNNDFVLTTRELGRLFRLRHIHLPSLKGVPPDDPLGQSTGAAVLFGATGGVMEAALRTAYELASGQTLPKLEFDDIRGLQGVKRATVAIPSPDGKGPAKEVRVGVVHGTAETRALLERMREGDPDAQFDFVEVMACRGGCIGGGGQPKSDDPFILQKRIAQVYSLDEKAIVRKSHENPCITKVYKEELGKPLGHKSHVLLHTSYRDRSAQTK